MIPHRAEEAATEEPTPWAIRSESVVTPQGLRPAAVLIRGEKIVGVVSPDEIPAGCPVHDVRTLAVLPGLVDTHVHINEPGRTEWEGFATATRAAAAGGITTLVDMPLNSSPVTTSPNAFEQKLAAARGQLFVDCGFYGGIVPDNLEQIEPLLASGVLGLKAFLCHSGIEDFANVTEQHLRAAMPMVARSGLPLLVHAELPSFAGNLPSPAPVGRSYGAYLASRPRTWEHAAIRLMRDLGREYRCRVHVVHLSAADALPQFCAEGLTFETCPHYLHFAAEEIPDGDPRFKCAPPIRERENREHLWRHLRAGLITTIGSDHSPAPPELKELATGDLARAWGGIASLQLILSAVWSQARSRGFTLADLAKWMCRTPAELVGLGQRKGQLAPGFDADLVVVDPQATFVVEPEKLLHRHKITPYAGQLLRGTIRTTFLRGRKIYEAGNLATTPLGQIILHRTVRG
ncbi:MAG TPA: allantoinase AllB [Gemmataceae bacterium]|nr:allantoinase AllB [Gemmataceae bacterium]